MAPAAAIGMVKGGSLARPCSVALRRSLLVCFLLRVCEGLETAGRVGRCLQGTMQQLPCGGACEPRAPPCCLIPALAGVRHKLGKTLGMMSHTFREGPKASAAPQTWHMHEGSGAPVGGRRHPHRPMGTPPANPQFGFAVPQIITSHSQRCMQRYNKPAWPASTDCSSGSAWGRRGWRERRRHRWRHPSRRSSSAPLHPPWLFPTSNHSLEQLSRAAAALQTPPSGCCRGRPLAMHGA